MSMTPVPIVMSQEAGGDEQAAGVRPRNYFILRPPSGYYDAKQNKLVTITILDININVSLGKSFCTFNT